MVNDLIIIRLNNVHKDEQQELKDYLENNSWDWKEINKNTFYEKEKQKKGTNAGRTL